MPSGFNREVGIPSLKDFNIEKSSLEQIVGNVLADDCAMFDLNALPPIRYYLC